MSLIPIVVKRSRLKGSLVYQGALLNPDKQFYVYRVQAQHNPMQLLKEQMRSRTA